MSNATNSKGKAPAYGESDEEIPTHDNNNRPLPFTSAHNKYIETNNNLPRGALAQAYRETFGSQVPVVIEDLLAERRRQQELDLRTAWNSRRRRGPPATGPSLSSSSPTRHAKPTPAAVKRSSAERVAEHDRSVIRKEPISPPRAQQQLGKEAAATASIQRGGGRGGGGASRGGLRRQKVLSNLNRTYESFQRANAQRIGGDGPASLSTFAPWPRAGTAAAVAGANAVVPSWSVYGSPEQRRAAADVLGRSYRGSSAQGRRGARGGGGGYRGQRSKSPASAPLLVDGDDVDVDVDVDMLDIDEDEEGVNVWEDVAQGPSSRARLNASALAPWPSHDDDDDDDDDDDYSSSSSSSSSSSEEEEEEDEVSASRARLTGNGYSVPSATAYGNPTSQGNWTRQSHLRPAYQAPPPPRPAPVVSQPRTQTYRQPKFTGDFDARMPTPVSVRSPLFANAPRAADTTTSTGRGWFGGGGLFGSRGNAPNVPSSSSYQQNGRGSSNLFGNQPATPAPTPTTPYGGVIFLKSNGDSRRTGISSSTTRSRHAHSNSGYGLEGLDEETLEAIRLARHAARARRGPGYPGSRSRAKFNVPCFPFSSSTSTSSKQKKQNDNSNSTTDNSNSPTNNSNNVKTTTLTRPLPSPEKAPRLIHGNNGLRRSNAVIRKNTRQPPFTGPIPVRRNAVRDPHRNTGAQGVAGVTGIHRSNAVQTKRPGKGRPTYYEPHPDLRPQRDDGYRQAHTPGQWLGAGFYGSGVDGQGHRRSARTNAEKLSRR